MKESNNTTTQKKKVSDLYWAKEYVYGIHRTYSLLMRRYDKILVKENTLSFSQFIIMNALFSCGHSCNQSQLAEYLMLTEASISRHISLLKRKKYVVTVVEKNKVTGKKIATLDLTGTGKGILEKNEMLLRQELQSIGAHIDVKEKEIALDTIQSIMKTIPH